MKIITITCIAGLAVFSCKDQDQNINTANQTQETIMTNTKVESKAESSALKNHHIVRKAVENWISGEGSFFDLLDEDMVWRVTGKGPYSGVYRGKREFMDKAVVPINSFLSTGLAPELIDINASGDIVWLQWKGKAKAENGDDYINEYAWKLTLNEEGKITNVVAFLDTYALYKLVK